MVQVSLSLSHLLHVANVSPEKVRHTQTRLYLVYDLLHKVLVVLIVYEVAVSLKQSLTVVIFNGSPDSFLAVKLWAIRWLKQKVQAKFKCQGFVAVDVTPMIVCN